MLKKIIGLCLVILLLMQTGCDPKEPLEIVIAEQYGLAYAPLVIMREQGFLEETAGDSYKIRWIKLGNTAAIREAMLSDHLDIGFMGLPPFLIGVDQGMGWKIIDGLSSSPLGLMSNTGNINDLADLKGLGKIALPQPGSIQHILLSMAAERAFGDPRYFDQQLISMKHPEGFQALTSATEVVAHFTSPPYLFQEEDQKDLNLILTGEEAFGGDFSFIVGVCGAEFYEDKVGFQAFREALIKSVAYIYEEPTATVKLLSEAYELPPATIEDYVYHRNIQYELEVDGVQQFMDFMYRAGYLKTEMEEDKVLWE